VNGAWSYSLTVGQTLAAGTYAANATATDVAGNVSATSNTNNFTVDLTPPAAPVVITPANGSRTNNPTPTISGTAEANSSVAVFIDGNLVGTVTTNSSGAWTYTLTGSQALAEGTYVATARATDVAGNVGPTSNPGNSFTVDLTAPNAPVITTPTNNQLTNDNTPTISGTAEANSTVTIYAGGTQIGTATADGSGNWTFTPTTGLSPDGTFALTATATDVAGNVSTTSTTVNVVIDTTAPAAPVVQTPANNSIGNDNTPTFSGTAEANSTVAIFVGATQVGTATADSSGNWTFTPTATLADGTYVVTAKATDPAGNTGPTSSGNTFTIDTVAPAAPVVTAPADGSSTNDTTPTITGTAEANSSVKVFIGATLVGTVTADAQGAWTYTLTSGQALAEGSYAATATATDAAGNTGPASAANNFTVDITAPAAPVVVNPPNNSTIDDNTPAISGTAEANATVTVTVDGNVVGTATANSSGQWSYQLTPAQGLSNGQHSARATATDAAGNVSGNSNTNTFTVDAIVPAAPVVVNPKDGSLTNDDTPTVTGTAEAGSTVSVTIDGTVLGTTTADGQGNWTYTLTPAQKLMDGSHTVSAVATDAAGNASARSNQNTFTVDASGPGAPVIIDPKQNEKTGSTPTITGTAEANSTVKVFIDNVLVGTVTTDAQGNWSFTPTTPLADGAHTVTANSTDTAGNTSPSSAPRDFMVDTFDGGAGGGNGSDGGEGGGAGGGGEPPVFGYRGGGCSCGSTDAQATLGFGLLILLALSRRRRTAR
jgi:uncharacterized protein (TIGR03382 family)